MKILGKIFQKKQNSSTCCCGGNCIAEHKPQEGRFIVLGACCSKSKETYENTKIAVKEMGYEDEVINIGDMAEIARYGVMSMPALVIDGKVVAYGKLLRVDEIKKIIKENI